MGSVQHDTVQDGVAELDKTLHELGLSMAFRYRTVLGLFAPCAG
jgi:hypothetical protein